MEDKTPNGWTGREIMALRDIFKEATEIEIFDFLAENSENSYNQSELSEFTGISRATINKKMPDLIQNGLVEIDQKAGHIKMYKIANTRVSKLLIASILAHGFSQADKPKSKEEELDILRNEVGTQIIYTKNRYYKPSEFSYYRMEGDEEVLLKCEKTPMHSQESSSA